MPGLSSIFQSDDEGEQPAPGLVPLFDVDMDEEESEPIPPSSADDGALLGLDNSGEQNDGCDPTP